MKGVLAWVLGVGVLGVGVAWGQDASLRERVELLEGENRVLRAELDALRERLQVLGEELARLRAARRVEERPAEEGPVEERPVEGVGLPECGEELRVIQRWARSVAWSPDGGRLLSSGGDGNTLVWDARTGAQLQVLPVGMDDGGLVAWSGVGDYLAVLAEDRQDWLLLFNEGGRALGRVQLSENPGALAWSPRQREVAVGHDDGVWIYDSRGRLEASWEIDTLLGVDELAWSPDGREMALSEGGNGVEVWSVSSGQRVRVLDTIGDTLGVAWVPDSPTVLGLTERELYLWDAKDGRLLKTIEVGSGAREMSVSPDGRLCAVLGAERLEVWRLEDGVRLTSQAYEGGARGLAFGPGGRLALVCDSTVRVLQVPEGVR